ncbi:hypothetical protein OG799_07805 [Micromonospora sp. NBC_00898]|nr:hypothetical protein OG799_07805 [Micromonospora sp. NBC_00898]
MAKPFTDYTDEEYDLVTGINLAGFFHLTRRALPHLLATGAEDPDAPGRDPRDARRPAPGRPDG